MGTRNGAIQRVVRKVMDFGTGAAQTVDTLLLDEYVGEEVDAAVYEYSSDFPREFVKELTPGSEFIIESSLTGWVAEWSRLLAVEVDAGVVASGYDPTSLDMGQLTTEAYDNGVTRYVWLRGYTPGATEALRLRYTVPHTLTNLVDTIPAPHFDAVCDLGASYCCLRLEAKFSQAGDGPLQVDVQQTFRDSAARFRQAKIDFAAQYRQKVGLPQSGPKPATVFQDWDTFSSTGGDLLTHPVRYR